MALGDRIKALLSKKGPKPTPKPRPDTPPPNGPARPGV